MPEEFVGELVMPVDLKLMIYLRNLSLSSLLALYNANFNVDFNVDFT